MGRRLAPLAVVLVLSAVAMPAPSANAAGMNFRWSACAGDGGTSNRDFACDTDVGTNVVVASFLLDQPITGLFAIFSVVDMIVANDQVVPAWWEVFDFTGCRLGSLTADATIDPSAVNCVDWMQGAGAGGLIGWDHTGTVAPADTASHRRFKLVSGHDPPGVDVVANQEYFAFNLIIDNVNTTGGCAGCTLPVCLVLNSMQTINMTSEVAFITTGTFAGSNLATWQGGSGANCASVPTRRVTWGRVKALYR